MKILVISDSGEFLPVGWRLLREGNDVHFYIHTPQYRNCYDGIINKISALQLKTALKGIDYVVFDMVRANEKKKEDAILSKIFGLKTSIEGIFGPLADLLRKNHQVIGPTITTELLELDRKKGMETAKKMGLEIPEYHEFKTLKDGIKFLKDSKDLWVFKPDDNQDLDLTYVEKFNGELATKMENEYSMRLKKDISFILQKKIEGVEISTEVWINDKGPVHYNHTIENKRIMDGNLGLATGCQSNMVWFENDYKFPVIGPLSKMASYLHSQNYIGPCDVNCIIKEGRPYFVEWSIRMGWDALYCVLALLKDKLSNFFFNRKFDVDFNNGFGVSQRITIPPYPYNVPKLREQFALDVSVFGRMSDYPFMYMHDVLLDSGKLKCSGADGIIGVVTAWGKTMDEAWGRCYHNIGTLKIASYLQYRKDGLDEAQKRYKRLESV